jgi:hypothetical protein
MLGVVWLGAGCGRVQSDIASEFCVSCDLATSGHGGSSNLAGLSGTAGDSGRVGSTERAGASSAAGATSSTGDTDEPPGDTAGAAGDTPSTVIERGIVINITRHADHASAAPSVSADGMRIAFATRATNLTQSTGAVEGIVYDRAQGTFSANPSHP